MHLPIQMYDPTREHRSNSQIDKNIQKVIQSGMFINGSEVKELEKELADYTGVNHCITVGNGTDALQIALMALGVSVNDEVITVSHSWISTAEVISILGAKPVFVDIEAETFNINPELIKEAITAKTKAIIAVSLYGQIADFERINAIAEKHNLPVIEDAAQSFGATQNAKKSCSLTTIATTSFFPTKPLGCYGDGGACFTNDSNLAHKMRAIKNHGGVERFKHEYIGMNSRLDTIQAGVLLAKLPHFDTVLEQRNACAQYYTHKLKKLEEAGDLRLPKIKEQNTSAWAQYSILLTDAHQRDALVAHMKANQVNVAIFYPVPLHHQVCFSDTGDIKLPVTENVVKRIFNVPCYGQLTRKEQDYIIQLIYTFFKNNAI